MGKFTTGDIATFIFKVPFKLYNTLHFFETCLTLIFQSQQTPRVLQNKLQMNHMLGKFLHPPNLDSPT